MTDDLDKLEAIARAAQNEAPGPWMRDKLMTADCHWQPPSDAHGYVVVDARHDDVTKDEFLHVTLSEHIATFSPDVVLRLIERIRELEDKISDKYEDDRMSYDQE